MKRTRQERVRLGLIVVGMVVFFSVVVLRLGQFQIVHASEYGAIVERQSGGKIPIPAERGMIYDRYGRVLAKNVSRWALYAHPESKQATRQVAAYLEKVFDLSKGEAVSRYDLSANRFRWITRRLDDRLAKRITEGAPGGLRLRAETERVYPYGTVGKQILGFTDIDNTGLSGLELQHDSVLAGINGWADIRRDGRREIMKVREEALVKPQPGQSLVLTVDWQLQEVVEEELQQAVTKFNASSGLAAFVNCNNGEILAIAHYDPTEKNLDRPKKLRALADQFEPGSAFKPFTAAALLDAGLINFQDTVYCEMGKWQTGRRILHDDKELGWLTFRRIIELSSNIGLGKCALRLGGDAIISTYRGFGFGSRTGLGFPGEVRGSLSSPKVWSDYNVAAMAMGHSVATTALQMATAMAAIANGGRLIKPQLVLGHVDPSGRVIRDTEPEVIGHPLKESSADSLRSFLRGVVENGTGDPVNSKFVSIAGKTGTGQIPDLENGGYFQHRFMASFCGFFPYHAPVVAGIVVLEAPRPITYGGHTSGKAFRQIAERYSVSNPDMFAVSDQMCMESDDALEMTAEVPDFTGRDILQARMLAEKRGVKIRCDADEGRVVWQFPAPDRLVLNDDEVLLATQRNDAALEVINLKGLTIRKAAAFLDQAGINYEIEGTGCVTYQSLPPGTRITSNQSCRLRCRPIG
jgi:cell division protein FtsI (penicillin-binding protein 3)